VTTTKKAVRPATTLAVVVATVMCVTGCSTGRSPEAAAPIALRGSGVTAPVPTVVDTPSGTWASVPMGHLDDPLNTFWQLLYRPAGSASWSDQIGATATATNGGIALASGADTPLIVGVRPSNRLVFSPLIATTDGGHTWQDGLLPDGLADVPDAIAASSSQTLAVVTYQTRTQILAAGADLSSWHPVTTEVALAATSAGRACGLKSINAVAYYTSIPLVGGVCTRPAAPAVFAFIHGTWQSDGPTIDPAGAAGAAVLELEDRNGTLAGLFATTRPGSATSITAGWSTDAGRHWQTSPPLQLGADEQLTSDGPAGPDGFYVLASNPAARQTLEVIEGPGTSWQVQPSPPPGTEAVALTNDGPGQALSVNSATLTIWSLSSGSWVKGQVMNVAIDYGSSS
jgi:hypothetical protein